MISEAFISLDPRTQIAVIAGVVVCFCYGLYSMRRVLGEEAKPEQPMGCSFDSDVVDPGDY